MASLVNHCSVDPKVGSSSPRIGIANNFLPFFLKTSSPKGSGKKKIAPGRGGGGGGGGHQMRENRPQKSTLNEDLMVYQKTP